ncbi:hypothetical protein GH714_037524 [Hevea brasiliensis]|uniref:Beta-glucosidase n=1 Tax=Hevea brasiliensis TaxID=3981 RepID=A0A6A6MRE9_HEVBR|nr:hypothetical protein GH714_037524 [Hevea brasiliensis]
MCCGWRKNFIAYANVCFREFGDRVLHWTTLNEPNVFLLYSYDVGMLPPYRCSSPFGLKCSQGNSTSEPYLVSHHLLLAHASAVRLYRKKYQGKQLGFNGINLFVYGTFPLTNSTEDVLATQRATEFLVAWQRTRRTSSFEDTSRVKYMHGYVESVLDAIRNGSNVRGYFTWYS